jgi:hypothetical protein
VNRYATEETCKLLVGNKCDKVKEKKVSFDDAKAFADNLNIPLLETSAKNADNVEKAFLTMAAKLIAIRCEGCIFVVVVVEGRGSSAWMQSSYDCSLSLRTGKQPPRATFYSFAHFCVRRDQKPEPGETSTTNLPPASIGGGCC